MTPEERAKRAYLEWAAVIREIPCGDLAPYPEITDWIVREIRAAEAEARERAIEECAFDLGTHTFAASEIGTVTSCINKIRALKSAPRKLK